MSFNSCGEMSTFRPDGLFLLALPEQPDQSRPGS